MNEMIQESILESIESINQEELFAEYDVLMALCDTYTKSILISESSNLGFDGYEIIQEEAGDNKAKDFIKNKVVGNTRAGQESGMIGMILKFFRWIKKSLGAIVDALKRGIVKLKKAAGFKTNTISVSYDLDKIKEASVLLKSAMENISVVIAEHDHQIGVQNGNDKPLSREGGYVHTRQVDINMKQISDLISKAKKTKLMSADKCVAKMDDIMNDIVECRKISAKEQDKLEKMKTGKLGPYGLTPGQHPDQSEKDTDEGNREFYITLNSMLSNMGQRIRELSGIVAQIQTEFNENHTEKAQDKADRQEKKEKKDNTYVSDSDKIDQALNGAGAEPA